MNIFKALTAAIHRFVFGNSASEPEEYFETAFAGPYWPHDAPWKPGLKAEFLTRVASAGVTSTAKLWLHDVLDPRNYNYSRFDGNTLIVLVGYSNNRPGPLDIVNAQLYPGAADHVCSLVVDSTNTVAQIARSKMTPSIQVDFKSCGRLNRDIDGYNNPATNIARLIREVTGQAFDLMPVGPKMLANEEAIAVHLARTSGGWRRQVIQSI